MMKSQFFYPAKVTLESGCHRRLVSQLPPGSKRVLLVTGHRAMRDAGVLDGIENSFRSEKISLLIEEGVNTNPTHIEIDALCAKRAEFNADCIVGLGGGSSLDAAKLIAMQATNGGSVWDYINLSERPAKKIDKPALPIVAIPTTSGTGSESTPFAVVTHAVSRMKKGVGNAKLYPSVVLMDPELMALMPPRLVAITGLDAFGQALEAFTSGRSTFHSDYFGYSALQYLIPNLERSFTDATDQQARANVAWGAFLSGLAIGLVDVNLAHAMSHPISAHRGMQHGLAVFLCTIPAIEFNRDSVGEKYSQVVQLFQGHAPDAGAADQLIEKLTGWSDRFGLPLGLKNYDVPRDELATYATDALQIGAIKTNPREVVAEDLTLLFDRAWNGNVN